MRFKPWSFVLAFLSGGALLTAAGFVGDLRRPLVIGETSSGHRLLEARCEACHVGWRGPAADRCAGCHRTEMRDDVHPARLFDKAEKWARELAALDARDCTSCHAEHRKAELGFTADRTMCALCHAEIGADSPSHQKLAMSDCLSCHNYHYEAPIARAAAEDHLEDPDLLEARPVRKSQPAATSSVAPADAPAELRSPAIEAEWRASVHAQKDVRCSGCHRSAGGAWIRAADESSCAGCHPLEVESFHDGVHGVRSALGLGRLGPKDARLPMRSDAPGAQGCPACHGVHRLDLERAQVDACLGCHADDHSVRYLGSPHGKAYRAGRRDSPTCATCHLPSREVEDPKRPGEVVRVTWHNNSLTMRPPERMLGEVCLGCHGLLYAWSALKDDASIRVNFRGPPQDNPLVSEHMAMVRRAAAASDVEAEDAATAEEP